MGKPFLHLFLFTKIKGHTRTDIVDKSYLKEVIGRAIIKKGGLPRYMVKYIIDDMVEMDLIERINNRDLYKLKKDKSEGKMRALLLAY